MHSKCNTFESSQKHPPPPSPWRNCLPQKPIPVAKKVGDHWQDKVETLCHVTPPTSLSSASLYAQSWEQVAVPKRCQHVTVSVRALKLCPPLWMHLLYLVYWANSERVSPSFTSLKKPAWWPPLMHPRVPSWNWLDWLAWLDSKLLEGGDHFQIVTLSYSLYKWKKWALIVKKNIASEPVGCLGSWELSCLSKVS